MSEQVDLINARLDAWEAAAKAATPGPWRWTDSEVVNDVWDGGMVIVNTNGDPIANSQDQWYEADPGEPAPVDDATHISLNDPAAVLAMVAGLRAVVALHEFPMQGDLRWADDGAFLGSIPVCETCRIGRGADPEPWPCPTLTAIAAMWPTPTPAVREVGAEVGL